MAEVERLPLLERYKYLITILLVVAIAGGAAVFILQRPAPTAITILPPPPTGTPAPTETPIPSATPGPIEVYVTGAVGQPDTLLTLPYGSRVRDAVDAAGGMTADADPERVNLAQVLRDGDQVHVFAVEAENAAVTLPTPNDSGIVYINTATAAELEQLPRIGPAMAQRILEYREVNGPFVVAEDLLNVTGIGQATLDQIAPFISLENR